MMLYDVFIFSYSQKIINIINIINNIYINMDRSQVRSHMTHFLTHPSLSTLNESKKYLISLRNSEIKYFTLVQSRSLWFSLIFYKFREENNVTDKLYAFARRFLLDTISINSSDESYKNSANKYLEIFEEWKTEDRETFLDQIVNYYLEVLHLKQIIEETRDPNTINEWKESYQNLLLKIRNSANSIGFLKELDERVKKINELKSSIVKETMKRAYWDMIEKDIRNKHYISFISQLIELKEILKCIIPLRFHDDLNDKFDIDFIAQRLEHESKDESKDEKKDESKDILITTYKWILESIQEWDSVVCRPLYEREINIWEKSVELFVDDSPKFLRFSLELCTLLALDAKTRIKIWKSLLNL